MLGGDTIADFEMTGVELEFESRDLVLLASTVSAFKWKRIHLDGFVEEVLEDLENTTITFASNIPLYSIACPYLPRLDISAAYNLSNICISCALHNIANEVCSQGRIFCTHLLVHLLARAKSSCQIAWRNAPNFHSIFFQNSIPLPHHQVHTRLARSVGWDSRRLLGPALCGRFVEWQRCVSGFSECRGAASTRTPWSQHLPSETEEETKRVWLCADIVVESPVQENELQFEWAVRN